MAGPFDFLHIKHRTAGSSNELSFDVLDAARRDLDDKRRANRPFPASVPRPSQGNYRGVAGTSTLSAVPEVERRKRARRVRAIRVRVVAAVAVIGLVSVGAWAGMRFYEEKVDFMGKFTSLIGEFVEIDKSMVQVDALMADPLNSVERDARNRARAGFEALDGRLASVARAAGDMADDADTNDDKAALAEIDAAAQARRDMIVAAADAFKLSDIAGRQVADANDAWSKVLEGDAAARQAAELANAASTEQATLQARDKTQQALDLMKAGRSQLATVEQGLAGLDFSAGLAYVDKRIESLEAAVKTSDALLEGNRAVAIAANDAYNSADRSAAELARSLPASISDQVKDQYADDLSQKKGAYATARAAAIAADAALRTHLPSGR